VSRPGDAVWPVIVTPVCRDLAAVLLSGLSSLLSRSSVAVGTASDGSWQDGPAKLLEELDGLVETLADC
jgi:hypothetical protein